MRSNFILLQFKIGALLSWSRKAYRSNLIEKTGILETLTDASIVMFRDLERRLDRAVYYASDGFQYLNVPPF